MALIPQPDPRWQQAREAHAQRMREGTDKPGTTTASRLAWMEHQLSILALAPGFSQVWRDISDGARAILQKEKIDSILAMEPEAFAKAALALSDADARVLAAFLDIEHFRTMSNGEVREWLLSLIDPSKAAEIVFELLPIEQLEHVRVTRLVRGRRPEVTVVPAAEAPTPNGSTILVEALPEPVSRAHALAAFKQSKEPLPEL